MSALTLVKAFAGGLLYISAIIYEIKEVVMQLPRSIASLTLTGLALSASLALAGIAVSNGPAGAVVYCQYIGYPPSCVARPGVVLAPRPVARTAARAATASPTNMNGGVNRVGVRR